MKLKLISAILSVIIAASVIPAVSAAESPAQETAAPTQTATEAVTEPETAAPTEAAIQAPTEAPAQPATHAPRAKTDIAPTAVNYPEIIRIVPTANGTRLTWTAYPDAYRYRVFIRRETGGWKTIGTSSSRTFDHKNLVNDTVYTYTVRAIDRSGAFISACNTTGYSFRWFQTPELIRTDSLASGQKLVWNEVPGAERYMVYLKSSGKWISAGTTTTPYCVNTRVTSGKYYTYTVRVVDEDTSALSSYYDTAGLTAPYIAAPKNVAFNATSNGVQITWDPSQGADVYALYLKSSSSWRRIATVDSPTYTHTGLKNGSSYTYTVRAINSASNIYSGYSSRGWSFSPSRPPTVTSVKYIADRYVLSWRYSGTAASYRIFRKALGDRWRYVGKTTDTTFSDTKAEKNGIYTYTVRAMDPSDNYLTYFTESDRYYCMGIFIIGRSGDQPDTRPQYRCTVTESDLRMIVAATARGWMDAVEGDPVHGDILAYYNTYTPLAVGYKMQTHDAWCAAFTSAVWIRSGLAPYICTECGCGRFIDAAKAVNMWTESDAYTPQVGDAILYNWSDYSSGECTWGADHVGIVTSVTGNEFVVTEGNTNSGVVADHTRTVNQQFIRGYITPDYARIARYLSLKALHS